MMKKRVVYLAAACLLFFTGSSHLLAAERHELLEFVQVALRQSDAAYNVQESMQLSKLDVAVAEHQFATRVVPLTSIGFTQGTGSQQLGLELQKELETGTSVAYGLVGYRTDEDSDFVIDNSHNAKAYVRLSQGLFRRWGREYNRTAIDVANLRDVQNDYSARRTLQSLVLTTAQKYYTLILEDQLLAKTRQAIQRTREHLNAAVSRQSVGLVSKVDVYRAELAALSSENLRQSQNRQRQRALDDFREQLRLPEDEQLRWQRSVVKMTPVLPEDWQQTVFDNRLDWQQYVLKSQIVRRELGRAERDLMPDVDLNFTVEQRGEGDSIEEASELDETNWSIQLQLNSTFDNFNEETALTRKKIEISRVNREGEALRRKIIREVRDGFADLQFAEQQYQVNIRQLEQAQMALDLAKIRYEKGLSDNLDVLNAESAYSEAELSISRSLVAYNTAAVHLAYVMGILSPDWLQVSLPDTF